MPPLPNGRPVLVTERVAGSPLALHLYVLAAGCAALVAMFAMTQRIATYYHFDSRLGAEIFIAPKESRTAFGSAAVLLLVISLRLAADSTRRRHSLGLFAVAGLLALCWEGPIYHPARVMEWWPQLRSRPETARLRTQARLLGGVFFLLTGAGVFSVSRPPRLRRAGHSHGSAKWGTGDEFRATPEEVRSLREGQGIGDSVILGRHDDGSLIVLRKPEGHLITIATTRTGKGIGTVIPNALAYRGSMIIPDPKGEAFFVTGEHRRDRFGQTVYAIDPFEVTLRDGANRHTMLARYNPLRRITTVGPEARLALVRVRALVEPLILESNGDNAFWDRMARQVVVGLVLYICYQFDLGLPPERALAVPTPFGRDFLTLRHLTCLAGDDLQAVVVQMTRHPHPDVKKAGNIIDGADPRTRQNILTSAQSQLAFLDSPQMAAVLGEFVPSAAGLTPSPNVLRHADLTALKQKGVRQTVYLVVPPSYLESHAGWLRLMIVAVTEIMTATTEPPDLNVMAVMDEFANYGKLEEVRRGTSFLAGYGLLFWMIVQDLPQTEGVYQKAWATMFANSFVRQLFGTNDLQTAREISELTGETTVYSDSGNSGRSLDNAGWIGKGSNVGESVSEKGRKLLLPDEVLRMPLEKELLLIRGCDPLYVDKVSYLTMEELQGLYTPNPMKS